MCFITFLGVEEGWGAEMDSLLDRVPVPGSDPLPNVHLKREPGRKTLLHCVCRKGYRAVK